MSCDNVRDRILESDGTPWAPEVATHLETCASCRRLASHLAAVDQAAREAFPATSSGAFPGLPQPAPSRRPLAWAAAAAILLMAGGFALTRPSSRNPGTLPLVPAPPFSGPLGPSQAADLGDALVEMDAGSRGEIQPDPQGGWKLALLEGRCWVDTRSRVRLHTPVAIDLLPGTRAELSRAARAETAWSLLRQAEAADPATLTLRVLSGEAVLNTLPGFPCVGSGRQATLENGRLTITPLPESETARIDAWRQARLGTEARRILEPGDLIALGARLHDGAARLEAPAQEPQMLAFPSPAGHAVLTARIRKVTGHLVLRYPLPQGGGETTVGDLAAWQAPGTHLLTLRSGSGGTEIFLDGRRLLEVPPLPRPGVDGRAVAIGIRGGSCELERLAVSP